MQLSIVCMTLHEIPIENPFAVRFCCPLLNNTKLILKRMFWFNVLIYMFLFFVFVF
ncbi:hypothetical protein N476_22875 [Pseudoalteromonas luteoviolacea H33]|uniref:Uncharacterized protein n=1 Tax=Pseudoalteromonas luteoviolacea H33 TaxID=1365251 RepID=A0A167CH58_9GAMM|nr:hypothetical protein N476_22875 [Pseudoalteromonas luteoviolacea H33]KZN75685.1 hypothetical protein N477_17200 [Pseudoalteromonas luteoviolacea H33-S]